MTNQLLQAAPVVTPIFSAPARRVALYEEKKADLSTARPSPATPQNALQKVALPTMEGISFERVQNIVSLEADGNYTQLHFLDGRHLLVCRTLRDIELMLEESGQFVRIHRSYTVNMNYVQRYIKGKGGQVVMENGCTISVSVGKRQNFMDALKYYFGYF